MMKGRHSHCRAPSSCRQIWQMNRCMRFLWTSMASNTMSLESSTKGVPLILSRLPWQLYANLESRWSTLWAV
eukprot:284814776_3